MYLLAWILIGAVVGWGTGRVLQGNGYGPFMDTLMGVGGAVAGGFLMRSAGLATFLRKNEARSGQFVEGYQAISSPKVTFPLTFQVVCLTCEHVSDQNFDDT